MNRLSDSTSPYLLQHAKNPVDWYPWGDEALSRARAEDKPIFLSIGYAACHWCHVMAHESFEDPETASLMNLNFINVKVDREERPDLDAIYMQAASALTGSAGWPLSVFVSPDLRPFFAGTYYPPVARHGLPAFRDVLHGVIRAWRTDRGQLADVGKQLTGHLRNSLGGSAEAGEWSEGLIDQAVEGLVATYDWDAGGWGSAPKFPQPMALEFLLAAASQHAGRTAEITGLVSHCLRAMTRGGMYDVVGGGFARYSTDRTWHIPHFEKMLYDNALLSRLYLHAWQTTGETHFRQIALETLGFVRRELFNTDGGFYSSIDADSPEGEGSFYAWTQAEIRDVLATEAPLFETAYGITALGNWEGRIILQRALDDATVAAQLSISLAETTSRLAACHARLYDARSKRRRPPTDNKVLTAWSGLMLASFAEAARILDEGEDRTVLYEVATRSAQFLLSSLRPGGRLARSWRQGTTTSNVFLEDYAALVLGLLELYQTDFDVRWYGAAVELAREMVTLFYTVGEGFYDTPTDAENLLVRPQNRQDNATPSGGALACEALLRLAALAQNDEFRGLAESALKSLSALAPRYPAAFARWLFVTGLSVKGTQQIAILGSERDPLYQRLLRSVRGAYRPNAVIAASTYPPPPDAPALLRDRLPVEGKATAFVCRNFVCRLPATDEAGLQQELAA